MCRFCGNSLDLSYIQVTYIFISYIAPEKVRAIQTVRFRLSCQMNDSKPKKGSGLFTSDIKVEIKYIFSNLPGGLIGIIIVCSRYMQYLSCRSY